MPPDSSVMTFPSGRLLPFCEMCIELCFCLVVLMSPPGGTPAGVDRHHPQLAAHRHPVPTRRPPQVRPHPPDNQPGTWPGEIPPWGTGLEHGYPLDSCIKVQSSLAVILCKQISSGIFELIIDCGVFGPSKSQALGVCVYVGSELGNDVPYDFFVSSPVTYRTHTRA